MTHPTRSVRSALLALIAWLTALSALGLTAGTAHAADGNPPALVTGTISTSDGGAWTTPVLVQLLTFTPDGSIYPTTQDSQLIPVGGDPHFSLEAPIAGLYAVRARPAGGGNPTRYLGRWSGDRESLSIEADSPGNFLIDTDYAPRTGVDITLPRGVLVSGTVRGSDGGPVAGATVTAGRWTADASAVETIPGTTGAITSAAGRYTTVVAPGTAVSLSITGRTGYRSWVLGGQTETRTESNAVVADDDVSQDIALTPDWSGLGSSGRIVRSEACLRTSAGGTADLDGLRLDVLSQGMIVPADAEPSESPLSGSSSIPALVPYWSNYPRQLTWGVSGSTLCAIWRSSADGAAYQAIVDSDGEVTYNYGTIADNIFSTVPEAGWTEGSGADAERVLLPRTGDNGYADGSLTGLVHGSRLSDLPGRYRFVFGGFASTDDDAASATTAPRISPATPVAGQTLDVDTGVWTVPGGSAADLTFGYQWLRDGAPIVGATGPTLATSVADDPARYTARVTARRAGHLPVSARTSVQLLGAAPTADRPTLAGTPTVGRSLRVPAVSWTDGATTTSYQWRRNGVAIPGATGRTYVVRRADVATSLSVVVKARLADHRTGSVLSRTTSVPRIATTTRLTLTDVRRMGNLPTARVRIGAPGIVPTGHVEVRDGSRVVAKGYLQAKEKGDTTFVLETLTSGTHRYTAVFLGSPTTRRSSSPVTTVTIR